MTDAFIEPTPTRESCWRAIVMMGRNVATYKFALAASLIELSSTGFDFIEENKSMIRVGLTSINKPSVSMHGFRSLDRRRVNSSRVNVYALLLAKAAWYYPQLPDTL